MRRLCGNEVNRPVAYLVAAPRWFAAPVVVLGSLLGGLLSEASVLPLLLAMLSGVFIMAAAHTWNSFHDYAITGLDKGAPSERSGKKPYTLGQNLIPEGIITQWEAFLLALLYALISAAFVISVAFLSTWWVFLPWSLALLMAPLYSWGKLHYFCELFLALGFGPFAVMLGAAAGSVSLETAFLAGIPLGYVFGVIAETYDQWADADANVPRGLRNIGGLVWRTDFNIGSAILFFIALLPLVHLIPVSTGALDRSTAYAIFAVLPGILVIPGLRKKHVLSIFVGLGAIFLYALLVVLLEGIS